MKLARSVLSRMTPSNYRSKGRRRLSETTPFRLSAARARFGFARRNKPGRLLSQPLIPPSARSEWSSKLLELLRRRHDASAYRATEIPCRRKLFRDVASPSGLGAIRLHRVRHLPRRRSAKVCREGGRWALLVDGQPYLILGGQVHNSSGWPSELPAVWKSLAELHANTVEAPVYWEQMEPQEGEFSWDNVDAIVKGAREHNLRVVLLWFGTWKNGNMHYVPQWVKTDTKRFPRVVRADGELIDVLSASGRSTLQADKAAFVALMRHLKALDGTDHTVLMVQVENESGIIGST